MHHQKDKDMDPYIELFKLVLPEEIVENFDLVSIHYSADIDGRQVAHLHLDEMDMEEEERGNLIPNGFYNEQIIQDFPIRDKKVILHVRRRRWKTPEGKSSSRKWDLKAPGTRMSKDFAGLLKKIFGYIPDNGPLS